MDAEEVHKIMCSFYIDPAKLDEKSYPRNKNRNNMGSMLEEFLIDKLKSHRVPYRCGSYEGTMKGGFYSPFVSWPTTHVWNGMVRSYDVELGIDHYEDEPYNYHIWLDIDGSTEHKFLYPGSVNDLEVLHGMLESEHI